MSFYTSFSFFIFILKAQVVEHCPSPNVTAVEEIPYPGIMENITDVFDETPCIYPTIIELGENEEPQNEDNHQVCA